jgi:CheY-like chemotaxis protein
VKPKTHGRPVNDQAPAAVRVLVAEDDGNDAFLLERAFQIAGVAARLRFVSNGGESIAYLEGREPYADRAANPLPDLLLLDLKMPQTDGFEVLQWLKSKPELSHIAAIVFSGSDQPVDIDRAYALGAARYLVKPHTMDTLVQVVRSIEKFWLRRRAERSSL